MMPSQLLKIFITRILLSVVFSVFIFGIFTLFIHVFPEEFIQKVIKAELFEDLYTKYETLKELLDDSGLSEPIRRLIIIGCLSCIGFLKLKKVSDKLVTQFMADYPDYLLEPVTAPRSLATPEQLAPALVKPKGSYSERIYLELLHFVLDGAQDPSKGRLYPLSNVAKNYKFTWALITGRSGEGKSRLVSEVARQLSRRDLFGDAQQTDQSFSRLKKFWKRLSLMMSA